MPKITRLCAHCANSFQGRPRAKYCSHVCAQAARRISIESRFWDKVAKTNDPFSCWEFTGYRTERGYGYVANGNESNLAHRIAFTLTYGPFDPALNVLHRCDNTSCVRPDHLFLGTHADNMRDMMVKSRHRGERLNETDVRAIRIAASKGETLTDISRRFNVSLATISMAVNGITWKHVD